MSDDLVAFLNARLDEDEASARYYAATGDFPEQHVYRMFSEAEAKRAILAEYAARDGDVALMLGPDSQRQREWAGLSLAVRHLAGIYGRHPDHRQEWAPASASR